MRKIFTVCLALLVASCLNEGGVSPGTASTFIRYYNGGNNDQAVAMEVTPEGGFVILATTTVRKTEADIPHYKIKLIKTDADGKMITTSIFPDILSTTQDFTGSSIQKLNGGGYVITGEDIQTIKDPITGATTQVPKTLIMTVDESLAQKSLQSIYADGATAPVAPAITGIPASGKAVTVNSNGNVLVLSSNSPDKMYLTEIDKSDYKKVNWIISYSAGATDLTNKLFVDENGKILWSGQATKNGLTGIRMIKTPPNSINSEFDLLISQPGFTEVATDFCRFGYGYAITGSTNLKVTGSSATVGADTDILFKQLAPDGTVLWSSSFPLGNKDSQNDVGNAISSTQDGGLILLSSVNSVAIDGKGDTDYYLIKINAFGVQEWFSTFGSRYKDEGIAIRQVSGGGYVLLGTTTQGALKILTLIKTDKNGKIE